MRAPESSLSNENPESSVSSGYESWRRSRTEGRGRRLATLLAVGLFGLATIGALYYSLFEPFDNPDVHLVVLGAPRETGSPHNATNGELALPSYARNDHAAFAHLAGEIHQYHSDHRSPHIALPAPADWKTLGSRLESVSTGEGHVFLLYLSAKGVSENGTAYLEFPAAVPGDPPFRQRVQDVLEQIGRSRARVKLLLLDARHCESDVQTPLIVNEFPRLLHQTVEATGDRTLWVLNSHSLLERSHVSQRLKRSCFNRAVVQGLSGQADRNTDGLIDVIELHQFVVNSVSSQILPLTGHAQTQTPMLCWGGGRPTQKTAVTLLPVLTNASSDEEPQSAKPAEIFPTTLTVRDTRLFRTRTGHAMPRRLAIPELPAVLQSLLSPSDRNRPRPPEQPVTSAPPAKQQTPALAKSASEKTKSAAEVTPIPISTSANIPGRLVAAWALRDSLTDRAERVVTPMDTLPHAWRALEQRLLNCELRYRTLGPFAAAPPKPAEKNVQPREPEPPSPRELSARRLSDDLDEVLRLMHTVGALQRQTQPATSPLEQLVDRSLAARQQVPRDAQTIGMAEWCHLCCETCLSTDLQSAIQEFDRILASGSRRELAAWIANRTADQRRFLEFRQAAAFAHSDHLNWLEIRTILAARRYAEQIAAASYEDARWVGRELQLADQHLIDAERQLRDGLGEDAAVRSRRLLTQAVRQYVDVADRLRLLRTAKANASDLQYRAADLLRWQQSVDTGPDNAGPGARPLSTLYETLSKWNHLLYEPAAANDFESVRRLTVTLSALQVAWQHRLRNQVETISRRLIDGRDPLPGDISRLEVLLGTTLPDADTRLAAVQAVDRLTKVAEANPGTAMQHWQGPNQRTLGRTEWRRLLQRAEWNTRLAELLAPQPVGPEFTAVRHALKDLADLTLDDMLSTEKLWVAHRTLADALSRFYTNRQRGIDSLAENGNPQVKLSPRTDALFASARVLSGLDRAPAKMPALIQRQHTERMQVVFTRQAQRLLAALPDASTEERAALVMSHGQLRKQAAELFAGFTVPTATPPIVELNAVSPLSLVDLSAGEVRMPITNLGTKPVPVRTVVEYDGRLLDIRLNEARSANRLIRGVNQAAKTLAAAFDSAPEITLSTATPLVLRLSIHRRDNTSHWPTQVIVHVRTGDAIFRRSIPVRLPSPKSVELHIARANNKTGLVSPGQDRPILQPFPNRETACTVRLRTLIAQDRSVDVHLYAPQKSLPIIAASELTTEEFRRWQDRLGPLTEIALHKELALTADGGWTDVKLQATPAKTPADAKPATKTNPLADSSHGLLILVRDRRTGRVSLRSFGMAVQRPRRFLRADAAFDVETRRLEIRIAAKDVAALPEGPVNVHCDLSPALSVGLPAKLEGELTSDAAELRLDATIPATLGPFIRAEIHIDGFPRAFVFRVPTDRTATRIEEDVSRRGVVVTVPADKTVASKTQSTIPVFIRVDAPVGAFANRTDAIAIGVDSNRNRVFDGDTVLTLPSDRDAVAGVEKIGENGEIVLRSVVTDWTRDIDLSRFPDRRVNLLGRLTVNGASTWSNWVSVVMDAQPPAIEPLRALTAVEGESATFSISATDFGLSGIAVVEVAVDSVGLGRFPKDPPPAVAVAGPQGRWIAKLPLEKVKPGVYPVIVRATDRAGNVSPIVKTQLAVLTKAQAAELAKPKPNRVMGVVLFDGDPIGEATVTLQPLPAKDAPPANPAAKAPVTKIPDVTTDEKGRFLFPAVPPGNYQVVAKKRAVANKNRAGRATLVVPPLPKTTMLQKLELR